MFSKLFTVIAFVAALASAAPANNACTRTATVVQGDTCDAICQRTKTPLSQLHHFNSWIDPTCTNLHAGNSLCLAQKGKDCTGENAYTVTAGDGCLSIIAKFNIKLDVFLANNDITEAECPKIHAGEVVCVAKAIIDY